MGTSSNIPLRLSCLYKYSTVNRCPYICVANISKHDCYLVDTYVYVLHNRKLNLAYLTNCKQQYLWTDHEKELFLCEFSDLLTSGIFNTHFHPLNYYIFVLYFQRIPSTSCDFRTTGLSVGRYKCEINVYSRQNMM